MVGANQGHFVNSLDGLRPTECLLRVCFLFLSQSEVRSSAVTFLYFGVKQINMYRKYAF